MQHSFFEQFSDHRIFSLWNSSQTFVEIVQKLGLTGETWTRCDYEYISRRKTHEIWKTYILGIDREREKQRPSTFAELPREQLMNAMNSDGIEKVSHWAFHFLLSEKHGRKQIKERVLELDFPIKAPLTKGILGVSAAPIKKELSSFTIFLLFFIFSYKFYVLCKFFKKGNLQPNFFHFCNLLLDCRSCDFFMSLKNFEKIWFND